MHKASPPIPTYLQALKILPEHIPPKEVADVFGVDISTAWRWKRGCCKPSEATQREIVEYCVRRATLELIQGAQRLATISSPQQREKIIEIAKAALSSDRCPADEGTVGVLLELVELLRRTLHGRDNKDR